MGALLAACLSRGLPAGMVCAVCHLVSAAYAGYSRRFPWQCVGCVRSIFSTPLFFVWRIGGCSLHALFCSCCLCSSLWPIGLGSLDPPVPMWKFLVCGFSRLGQTLGFFELTAVGVASRGT